MASNRNNEGFSNQNSDGGLLQGDSSSNFQDDKDSNPGQLKDKLNTSNRNKSDQGPVERQLDETPKSKKGPLAALAERVAENPTVQRAAYHIPNSARPLLGSVVEPVSRVTGAVDSTLTTEEGTRLASTANEFIFALAGFTLMLLTLAVTKLESTFNVVPSEEIREITDPMATSGDGFDRGIFGDDIPRNQLYMKKAQALCSRYVTLVSGAVGLRKNPPPSHSHSHTSSSTTNNGSSITDEVSEAADRVIRDSPSGGSHSAFNNDNKTNNNIENGIDSVDEVKESLNINNDFKENENGNDNENGGEYDSYETRYGNTNKVRDNNRNEADSRGYAQSAMDLASRASNATADYLRSVLPDRKKNSGSDQEFEGNDESHQKRRDD